MIGWTLATYISLPDSQPSFHWAPVNRVSSRCRETDVVPWDLSCSAVARARSPRPAWPAVALGLPASSASSTSPPPTRVRVWPSRTVLVWSVWPGPMEDRAAHAVSTLLVEAGVTPVEADRSSSSSPVATSMTEAVTFPPVRAASEATPWA